MVLQVLGTKGVKEALKMEVVWVIDLLPLRSKCIPKYLPRDQQENSFNHLSFKVSMVLTFLGREQ